MPVSPGAPLRWLGLWFVLTGQLKNAMPACLSSGDRFCPYAGALTLHLPARTRFLASAFNACMAPGLRTTFARRRHFPALRTPHAHGKNAYACAVPPPPPGHRLRPSMCHLFIASRSSGLVVIQYRWNSVEGRMMVLCTLGWAYRTTRRRQWYSGAKSTDVRFCIVGIL